MKPAIRTGLSFLPLILQFFAMASALAVISFFLPPLIAFLKTHEGKFMVPGPTRLLVEHSSAAKIIIVGLFGVSLISFLVTRSKMKDEFDRLLVQSAVYGLVWYAGILYIGAVLMAAALPYFALNQP
jgi:hypothetical protein